MQGIGTSSTATDYPLQIQISKPAATTTALPVDFDERFKYSVVVFRYRGR